MPEKFSCPACGNENIVLKLDTGKEAECGKCAAWNAIPPITIQTDQPLNCRVRPKNSVMDLPPKNDIGQEVAQKSEESPAKNSNDKAFARIRQIGAAEALEPIAFRDLLLGATPRTFVTRAIIVINVMIFAVMAAAGVNIFTPGLLDFMRWGAKDNYMMLAHNEWWRFVSAFFIHAGIYHLALTMWFLWISGNFAERIFGNARFCIIFIAGGVGGTLASFIVSPQVVGSAASAPVLGIAGSLVAFLISGKVHIPLVFVRKIIQDMVIFLIASIIITFFSGGIDTAASLGGLVAGFGCGLVFKRELPRSGNDPDRTRFTAFFAGSALVIILGLFIGTALGKDTHGEVIPGTARIEELLNEGKVGEALALLDKKPELLESLPNKEIVQGLRYKKNGDYDNAIKSFSESIRKNPTQASLRLLLGQAYIDKKSFPEAIDTFREMIRLSPQDAVAYGDLAWVYYLTGDFHTCKSLSEKALEIDKTLVFAQYNIGLCMLRLEDGKKAADYYRHIAVASDALSKEARQGAIEDLIDLVRANVKKAESLSILSEIFHVRDSDIPKDQNDVSA